MAAERADRTCKACKGKKRRCDKELPQCGLCRRVGRLCEYDDAADSTPTVEDFAAMQTKIHDLEERLSSHQSVFRNQTSYSSPSVSSQSYSHVDPAASLTCAPPIVDRTSVESDMSSNFPASAFLDLDLFRWAGHSVLKPNVGIPMDVLELLNQGNIVMDISAQYFDTVHSWIPFISKKRMEMGISVQSGGAELALILLAMKLVISRPEDVADESVYSLAKGFLNSLETSGLVSLMCLQASILIALYEYGHSIYPAAWMTVGNCARYAELLGISSSSGSSSLLSPPRTWTEVEERRRTWWAVYVLDRLISCGSKRSCAFSQTLEKGKLPVDDDAWDSGDVARAVNHSTSANPVIHQSGFAMLCQAAIFTERAQASARKGQSLSPEHLKEITDLSSEILTFLELNDQSSNDSRQTELSFRNLTPCCVARSALFICLEEFTCPEKIERNSGYSMSSETKEQSEIDLQAYSMQVVRQASLDICDLVSHLLDSLIEGAHPSANLGKISPFLLDGVYCALSTFHWLYGEHGDDTYLTKISTMETVLNQIGVRWWSAKRYSQLSKIYSISSRMVQ